MCGIAGSVNQKLDIPLLTRCLYHRGPDAQQTFEQDHLQLHHHRLAIVDIAGGHQPMHYRELTIIFNGEIYNHLDVRKEMSLACESSSDTETILHAYYRSGVQCFEKFDGMFALAIYDRRNNSIVLGRDRAGKKPLYYYSNGNRFVFASELNALRQQLDLSINEQHIQQYIRMGYFYKSSTPYQDITELPAGSYATVPLDKPVPQIKKWWNIHTFYKRHSSDTLEQALATTDALLHKAVKTRVESSDLEVGSFLSGGIDSGIVSAIATEYNSRLQTFTVSFDGEYDEAPLAKLVAERYGTRHHEIRISFDHLLNDIETILSNYGEPFFDSSAIPSYYVSREAKKHLTVILNGDGGDELFGGYRRYVPFLKYDFLNPAPPLRALAGLANKFLPVPHNKKSRYNYIYRLIDMTRKKGLDTYLSATIDSFEGFDQNLITDNDYLKEVEDDFAEMNRSGLSGLKKIMNLDFDNILAGNLLVKMDIATMAHSLEGRSPLLSKGVLEYLPSLPDEYKIKGAQTKFLLRKLSEKYLPAELINQPKRGFEIPLKKWIDGELKQLIGDYLFSTSAYSANYIQPGFLNDLWNRKIRCSDEKRAKMLWTIFALEVWYKKCYKIN
ncbi:MAG: asparagine synthase (glutamine-hydrolyzing) [Citrobacter freundii]|nr:MAG: asparagine synthase (glutamine-hydrolyzing) [Citrobacter freundii]